MNRLHDLSARFLAVNVLQSLLEEVLDVSIMLLNADFGNIQLYDAANGTLQIVAQRGFQQEFLDYFKSVREATNACGMALERGERVIVEDVLEASLASSRISRSSLLRVSGRCSRHLSSAAVGRCGA